MRNFIILISLLVMVIPLLSCSKELSPVAPPFPEEQKKESIMAERPSWQKEWDRTAAEAKKEGKVVLYGSFGPQTRTAIMEAMKKKYGLDVEAIGGRSIELLTRLKKERQAGLFLVDLMMSGDSPLVSVAKPEGMLDPVEPKLLLPEVLENSKWYEGRFPWLDKEKFILMFAAGPSGSITINTSLVKHEEINSYKNLLEPRWKGKIVINNPARPGPGNSWFTNMVEILGTDYMRALAGQETVIISDERLQTEWIIRGKYPISIAIGYAQNFQHFAREGAPVAMHKFVEGEYMTAGDSHIVIFNKAPHPNAAKVFLNWLLTPETQTMMSKENLRQSLRTDVSTDFLPAGHTREAGKKYPPLTEEKVWRKIEVLSPLAQEIFGPLIR